MGAFTFLSLLALFLLPKPHLMSSTTVSAIATSDGIAAAFPEALRPDQITILAYGALLSEASSRLTFPDLEDFRHVRVRGLRRVFAHPHLFLLQQGLTEGLKLASLSAEPADEESSFVVAAFTVKLNDRQRTAFMEREASYDIVKVPYYDLMSSTFVTSESTNPLGTGVICLKGTDEQSQEHIAKLPPDVPFLSIWEWPTSSGILPADIYLRHCLLAVEKEVAKESGRMAKVSFWNDTYLADRKTRLATYLSDPDIYHQIMNQPPPPALATRFGG